MIVSKQRTVIGYTCLGVRLFSLSSYYQVCTQRS